MKKDDDGCGGHPEFDGQIPKVHRRRPVAFLYVDSAGRTIAGAMGQLPAIWSQRREVARRLPVSLELACIAVPQTPPPKATWNSNWISLIDRVRH